MASTGLRIGEALALEWRHVQLDGSAPHVKVQRGALAWPPRAPKTRSGRRDVPLDPDLAIELRLHRVATERDRDRDLVFPSRAGTPLSYHNLRRAIRPVLEEIGLRLGQLPRVRPVRFAGDRRRRHQRRSARPVAGAQLAEDHARRLLALARARRARDAAESL
jgi:integrase